MLQNLNRCGITSQRDAVSWLGREFKLSIGAPEWYTDYQAGKLLLDRTILVHLKSDFDKFNTLIHMIHKLLALVHKEITMDNPDSLIFQEIVTPGHLFLHYLKERLEQYMFTSAQVIEKEIRTKGKYLDKDKNNLIPSALSASGPIRADKTMHSGLMYFFNTGNFRNVRGNMGVMQVRAYGGGGDLSKLQVFFYFLLVVVSVGLCVAFLLLIWIFFFEGSRHALCLSLISCWFTIRKDTAVFSRSL